VKGGKAHAKGRNVRPEPPRRYLLAVLLAFSLYLGVVEWVVMGGNVD
jgi:hypothetical protein